MEEKLHADTAKIRQKIKSAPDLTSKLSILHQAYKNDTAYLLTCGPSFGSHDTEELQKKLEDKLVIAVKQTYDSVGAISDFHLLNAWNYKTYSYADPEPIVLFESHHTHPETPGLKPDLHFNCINVGNDLPREEKLRRRLCTARNFDDYMFTQTPDRPWGPGIMYELGFYLCVHLGVRKIITLGWDIGTPNSQFMPHFYADGKNQHLGTLPSNIIRDGKILNPTSNGSYIAKDIDETDNRLVNIPGYYENEVVQIADSTSAVYQWLGSKGIELEIISDFSIASDLIPRAKL